MKYLRKFNESGPQSVNKFETDPQKIIRSIEGDDTRRLFGALNQFCNFNIEPDGTLNIEKSFNFDAANNKSSIQKTGRFPFKFGTVGGNFVCEKLNLTTLEGCPRSIGECFYCGENKLTDLRGGPEEVGGDINMRSNLLTSLEGFPKIVKGRVIMNNCPHLYSPGGFRDSQIGGSIVAEVNCPLGELHNCFKDWVIQTGGIIENPDGTREWLVPGRVYSKLSTKNFQDSLDYNYLKYEGGQWLIDAFRFKEALDELNLPYPHTPFRYYKFVDEDGELTSIFPWY